MIKLLRCFLASLSKKEVLARKIEQKDQKIMDLVRTIHWYKRMNRDLSNKIKAYEQKIRRYDRIREKD